MDLQDQSKSENEPFKLTTRMKITIIIFLSLLQLGVPICTALLAFGQEQYDDVSSHTI